MDILSVLKQVAVTLEYSRREHDWNDDDNWYSCPLAPGGCADDRKDPNTCYCGADKFNAEIDKVLEIVHKAIAFLKETSNENNQTRYSSGL